MVSLVENGLQICSRHTRRFPGRLRVKLQQRLARLKHGPKKMTNGKKKKKSYQDLLEEIFGRDSESE